MNTEEWINAVRLFVAQRLPEEECRRLAEVKLTYGATNAPVRGTTHFDCWQNGGDHPVEIVTINALSQESLLQLAGTTVHELAHVLAGRGAGHGKAWKDAAKRLGLTDPRASGTVYDEGALDEDLRKFVDGLGQPSDGQPVRPGLVGGTAGGCSHGRGARGGKSRGPGSGSRLRKFVCKCDPQIIIRAARDQLLVTCNICETAFTRA